MKPHLRWSLALLAALVAGGALAFKLSPWPMALLIRHQFDREGERASRALVRHLPTGVAERLDQRYDPADGDAYFDVFYPEQVVGTGARLPCIVWVHGGGWILQVAPLRGRRGRRGGSMPGRLGSPQGDDPDP